MIVPQMNIYLSPETKERMQNCIVRYNWSKIAQQAFNAVMDGSDHMLAVQKGRTEIIDQTIVALEKLKEFIE